MKHSLVCAALLLACAAAGAQPVYKWTDDKGQVHYGDRDDAPRAGAGTTLNLRRPAPGAQAPASAPGNTGAAAPTSAPQSSNLPRCLVLARAMADSKDTTPATVRAQSRELLDLCPDTAYACTSYLRQPERNTCEALRMQPNGGIVSNRVFN